MVMCSDVNIYVCKYMRSSAIAQISVSLQRQSRKDGLFTARAAVGILK